MRTGKLKKSTQFYTINADQGGKIIFKKQQNASKELHSTVMDSINLWIIYWQIDWDMSHPSVWVICMRYESYLRCQKKEEVWCLFIANQNEQFRLEVLT